MKLYFSRNYSPRLAVATAKYLEIPLQFEFASPFDPAHIEHFRTLNPNHRLPILIEDDGTSLWPCSTTFASNPLVALGHTYPFQPPPFCQLDALHDPG
jgi:hypothetical protein